METKSITLIGLPGAGKSTVGVLLAKEMVKEFVDSDLLIQSKLGMSLQDYVNEAGYLALREVEQQILTHTKFENCVIATGGSAVYSTAAMQRLKQLGPRIYLEVSLPTMLTRVTNAGTRGLACEPGTTLPEIYQQRLPLYQANADQTIECNSQSPGQIVAQIHQWYLVNM